MNKFYVINNDKLCLLNIMIHAQNLKTVAYSIPLFRNCKKAYPLSSPNSTCYIMLPQQYSNYILNKSKLSRYICPIIVNQSNDCCFIALQGQCLNQYILSKKNNHIDIILTEQQIWNLIVCMCQAFQALKQNQCADKLTHFKQYNILRVPQKQLFKLIFHESMVSQLDTAKSGQCQWYQLYLSPEQLTNKFVSEKSIVFSFGAVLLNICSNSDRNRKIYKLDKFQVDYNVIKQKLIIASQNYGYSILLCNFIESCLTLKYQERFNFCQLKQSLYRKLSKQFSKQSQLLGQIRSLQKGNKANISYDLCFPPNFKFKQSSKHQNLVKQNLHRTKSQKNTGVYNLKQQFKKMQKSKDCPEKKSLITQGRSSEKTTKNQNLQELQQFNKILINLKQNNTRIKSDQKQKVNRLSQSGNINYRRTFGQRQKQSPPSKNKYQQQQTTEKSNQIQKQNKREIYDNDKYQTLKKENIKPFNFLSSDSQNYMRSVYIQQMQKKNKNQLMLQITCQNGNHTVKEHACSSQQVQTPKGFGKFEFNKQKRTEFNQNHCKQQLMKQNIIYQSPQNIRKDNQLPALITKMNVLILDFCLKPVEQLINTIGKIGVWVEGDLYYGDFLNGRRHGLALQIFSNGQYYFGYFKQDLFSGEGFYFWNKKQYFFGNFLLGQKTWGRLEGEVQYQGEFKQNKRHGEGTCWYSTGQVYTGTWFNGKRNGHGTVIDPEGSKFVGNWVKGKRKGQGYLETDYMRIAGYWSDQIIQGESLIQYSNGDVFKGKTGKTLQKVNGQYISKTGRVFKGQFQKDQPQKGQLIYSNGDRYIGELYNMRRHGYGQYYYNNGECYKGMWDNNVKKGQ